MHGLVNRAIESFVRDTYGETNWAELARRANTPEEGFEAMFVYDDEATYRMLSAAEALLNRPMESILEDLGTYLVSNPRLGAIRRLLRFGGETFLDFLHSIDELPRRAALAVPDLSLPPVHVTEIDTGEIAIAVESADGARALFGHVLAGILRTMADEYGALAMLDHTGTADGVERITVTVLSTEFAEARPFQLSMEQ